ncbi:MAG: ring-cleaving dioxygenase [Rhizobiaceae bacterium]|nr:ring-cleaving dioxygenase [Rhizobiaceae bacterium]
MQLEGLHHLTAITANAPGNKHFYTQTLGLRLVKKTVNQDDTSAYHLFYADARATPGTDVTFFDWPVGQEKRGTHSINLTGLRVSGEQSLEYWKSRLSGSGATTSDIENIDGRASLHFEDPEGQRFRLVDDGGGAPQNPWAGTDVPAAHQIKGLGPVMISIPDKYATDIVLTRVMGMSEIREYASPDGQGVVHVYKMGGEGPASELHVAVQPGLPIAQQGAGGVHHVAFRTPDAKTIHEWAKRLSELRIPNSGEVERYYFRSLYFREPGGNLFEIATDGPGFAVDEPLESLGERLALPPFLEPRRAEIEANLKPLD